MKNGQKILPNLSLNILFILKTNMSVVIQVTESTPSQRIGQLQRETLYIRYLVERLICKIKDVSYVRYLVRASL